MLDPPPVPHTRSVAGGVAHRSMFTRTPHHVINEPPVIVTCSVKNFLACLVKGISGFLLVTYTITHCVLMIKIAARFKKNICGKAVVDQIMRVCYR